jgi:predicted Zn-dependent protease
MRGATLLLALVPLTAGAQDSRDKQQAIGKQLAQEVERQSTIITDPALVQYVDRIAQKLALAAGLRGALTVKVITGDSSYALPAGFLYIGTNLILKAASEAELAGIIAHQLAHIALWDDEQRAQLLAQLEPQNIAGIPLIWYAGCQRLSGAFAPAAISNQEAALESRADQLALGFMDKAGYDPGALADFFERTEPAKPPKPSVFRPVVTLPAATRTAADAMRNNRSDYIVTTSEFAGVEQHLTALLTPTAPTQDVPTLYPRRRVAPEVADEVTLLRDPVIESYVNRIAGKLSQAAVLKAPLTVKVIVENSPRAITLPEGITYLTTQLILTAVSESELAGAIAHQIGHLVKAQDWVGGSSGLCLRVSGTLNVPVDQLSGQSDAEAQTDLRGLEYMDTVGYDPGALADLYQRILQQMGSGSNAFTPWLVFPQSTRDRADALRNSRTFVIDTSEFRKIQQRLMSLAH